MNGQPRPRTRCPTMVLLNLPMLILFGCLSEKKAENPVFNGVAASFTLTKSRIKKDQKLEAHIAFRNMGYKATTFRYYEASIDARLYHNGQDLGLLCPTADNPIMEVILQPGQTYEFTDELFITRCYDLRPGRYSIRFNYNLSLLPDALRVECEEKYRHPDAGIVSWDEHEHPFTVVR